jgi:hypothetical protein
VAEGEAPPTVAPVEPVDPLVLVFPGVVPAGLDERGGADVEPPPPPGERDGDGEGDGLGVVGGGDEGGGVPSVQTSFRPMGGGATWVPPESPVPQVHPSISPSEIDADPAPTFDHVQPFPPSQCQ